MSRRDNKILDKFEPSLTKQSFKDECNINNIVAKFSQTGTCNHVNARNPRYIDCVGVQDYQHALDIVHSAEEQFDALPAKIRAKFDNDPAKLMAYMDDPANAQEAAELGLIATPPDAPKSAPTEAKNAPTSTSQDTVAPKP